MPFQYYYNARLFPVLNFIWGKKMLLDQIRVHYPKSFRVYHEPFVGSGAVFLDLKPYQAVISDSNTDIIEVYEQIHHNHKLFADVARNGKLFFDDEDCFYHIRDLDRKVGYRTTGSPSMVFRAARFLYLNAFSFKNICRYNFLGQYNSPYGGIREEVNYRKRDVLIKSLHKYFTGIDVIWKNEDFRESLQAVEARDFCYLDPPYYSNDNQYGGKLFTIEDQLTLKKEVDRLTALGARVMLTNANIEFNRKLYKDYNIFELYSNFSVVNSKNVKAKTCKSLLIKNYA